MEQQRSYQFSPIPKPEEKKICYALNCAYVNLELELTLMLFCTLRLNREYYGKTECKNYSKALIDFVVKTCSITRLKMARQEKLFHSLRRFNSYVLTLVTFISETAQEIYYYNARREVRKRLQLFSWYFKIGTKIEM